MTKLNPKQAAVIAESIIVDYVETTGCTSEADVSNVLELLISKSARAIEKSCGNGKATEVCYRTLVNVSSNPMRVAKH